MKRITTMSKSMVGLCGLVCLFFTFQSCVFREDLTGTYPVIEEELIGEYLANDTQFSEFTRMLDTSGVMGLLNAYGLYTVFAPTNEAIQRYYRTLKDENGEYTITSMNQLSLSEIREFCYNHIVKGDSLKTKFFKEGTLGPRSMSERFITISFNTDTIIVNGICPILDHDIEVHNGLIHVLGEAFAPARIKIAECFEADSLNFSIYIDALKMTGLYKMLNDAKAEDDEYNYLLGWQTHNDQYNPDVKPKTRKLGYTILAVSDADLKNCLYSNVPDETASDGTLLSVKDGIDNVRELELLARYYYSRKYNNDADTVTIRTNRKHYLNRFMSYHCLDRVATSSRFIKDFYTQHHDPAYPMPDYVGTLLENTILETLMDKSGKIIGAMKDIPNSEFGVFNYDDPNQRAMLTDIKDKPNGGSLNGYYHGITKPIMYTNTLENELSLKRLRMDVASFLPELTTNNMRGGNSDVGVPKDQLSTKVHDNKERCWVIDDVYVDGFYGSPNTRFKYIGISPKWEDYQGDEFYVTKQYNFTLETLPIPAGTYEVRIGYQATTERAISQLYFDSLPCGIPLDLAITASDAAIGWEEPGTNTEDPNGFENDKMMHNRGYMKGPATYRAPITDAWNAASARVSPRCIRRVLGIMNFDKTTKHYFSTIYLGTSVASNTGDPQFMIDYIEFCPIEILDKEDIY